MILLKPLRSGCSFAITNAFIMGVVDDCLYCAVSVMSLYTISFTLP